MKTTEFAQALHNFFQDYLVHQKGNRVNTVKSYRDMFRLLFEYISLTKNIRPDAISLDIFDAELICQFLNFIEKKRHCSKRTRNQRLAAIHSFIRFMQFESPERMVQWQQIMAIPSQRCKHNEVKYLSQEEMVSLLSVIPMQSPLGCRDKALFTLLYDTGARVQELVDLCIRDINLNSPAKVRLTGKGGYERDVPLMPVTTEILKKYLAWQYANSTHLEQPLFINRCGESFSRFGIAYLLQKYADMAKEKGMSMPQKVTPHMLRNQNLNKIQHFCKSTQEICAPHSKIVWISFV